MAFEDSLKSITLNADASIAGYTGVSNVGLGGFPSSKSLTATISYASNVNTFTTPSPHGFSFGDTVVVTGATAAANNGSFVITGIASATTFTVTNSAPGVTQSGAGITVTRNISTAGNQYRFVKVAGAKTAGLCTANDDYSIGVLQNKPQVVGAAAQIGFIGVSFVIAGASVSLTAGDKVMSDVLGAAVKAAPTVLNADVSTSSGFAVSSGVVTLTLGTSTLFKVGDTINITGATSAKNNGTFTVASITSGTVLTYNNAVAVAENGVASATTVGTRATAIRQPVIAGTALASSSTAGELIPVLLAAR